MLQGVAALLLAAEWLPVPVDAFAPANRSALQTALFGCVGACNNVINSGQDTSLCAACPPASGRATCAN